MSRPLLLVVVATALVELALAVVALVVLARTPPQRLRFGARWPWVAIVLLVSTVGPILFLAVGRLPAVVRDDVDPAQVPTGTDPVVQRSVDLLYPREPPT